MHPAFDNYEDLDRLDPYSKRVAEYMDRENNAMGIQWLSKRI